MTSRTSSYLRELEVYFDRDPLIFFLNNSLHYFSYNFSIRVKISRTKLSLIIFIVIIVRKNVSNIFPLGLTALQAFRRYIGSDIYLLYAGIMYLTNYMTFVSLLSLFSFWDCFPNFSFISGPFRFFFFRL